MGSAATTYGRTFAPEPYSHTASADDVIRHRLVQGMENYVKLADYLGTAAGRSKGELSENRRTVLTVAFVMPVMVADLLLMIQDFDEELANNIAREFLTHIEDGDYYPRELYRWLWDAGVDPDRLIEESREQIAREV